ncbi:phosphinothricin N-acetyltransferase [Pseudanabaena sp. lw0831]|uniref:GNAT family N-acetyltransferase n=1 Tax=Pseudanabaena sp. lw0831 TaxID=1357935 RepID=UPI001915B8D5|nr:GNAT family N-acetyltransferase [Pseudanabaena sp. lw0831]GBO56270.1 phosphinothricin N-acetyltransferase [Pseudanabaena sp. lw0831]
MQIRLAIEADLPAIIEIYNAAIPSRLATADLEPISVESRRTWFRSHGDRYPVWVIAIGDRNIQSAQNEKIVGWISLQMFYGRPAYHKTAEVSIYIDPLCQGNGIGKELLSYAIAQCPKLNITKLVGFVFAHNAASRRLFERFGFTEWGFLPKVAELDGIDQSLVIFGKII